MDITTNGTTMQSDAVPSDLGGPTHQPAERGNGGALMRMFNSLSDSNQQELLRYAVELTRKPKE